MSLIYTFVALLIFIGIILYTSSFNFKKIISNEYFSLISIALLVRIIASKINPGFESDIMALKNASVYILANNPSDIYNNLDFAAFPPVYIFILYIIGLINSILGLAFESEAFSLLIKLPAIICDIITGVFIYKLAYKKMKPFHAWLCALFYIINPAIILISSVWGQYESIYTLFLLLSIYYLAEENSVKSSFYYTFAILTKPTLLILLPVYLYVLIKSIIKIIKQKKSIIPLLLNFIVVGLIVNLFLIIPFFNSINIKNFYLQMSDPGLKLASINAYNFFAFIGANWHDYNEAFIGISYKTFSDISLTFIFIVSMLILFFNDDKDIENLKNKKVKITKKYTYFFVIASIIIFTCMLTVQIHERYLFPAIAFLLVTYIYSQQKNILILLCGFSATYFLNCVDIIYWSQNGNNYELINNSMSIVSFANILLLITTFVVGYKLILVNCFNEDPVAYNPKNPMFKFSLESIVIEKPRPFSKMSKKDWICLSTIIVVYSLFAFINLGNTSSAQTLFVGDKNSEVLITLDKTYHISRIQHYLGPQTEKKVKYWLSLDNKTWTVLPERELTSVFAWDSTHVGRKAKYIKIKSLSEELMLFEVGIRDSLDNLITVQSVSDNGYALFDEQDLVPLNYHYLNSSYFDEVYHPRTAYEFVHHMKVYEWTHPPLGKVIMSWSVMIFGMTPFGWRFAGTFFGVLMIPLIYLFAKKMFDRTKWAVFATILFTFDFMHFAQSRLATIDTYVTFFILGMYYFMYKYYRMSIYYDKFSKTLSSLFFCGIFMGLSIASKWPGVYAIAGVAFIFFYTFYNRYKEYLLAKEQGLSEITSQFFKKTYITFACCIVFFIIIPLTVYCLSYIPFLQSNIDNPDGLSSLGLILKNQQDMLGYHSHLADTHPFASEWWKWPIMFRPIYYYAGKNLPDGIKAGISAFGNPALWWGGIVATFYTISALSRRFSKTSIFLLVSYASQFLPWALITGRTTYIYHYFPSVPFVALIMTFFFKDYVDKENIKYAYFYMFLTVLLFIMFLPVLSGIPVSDNYIKYFLRWFPSWVLA